MNKIIFSFLMCLLICTAGWAVADDAVTRLLVFKSDFDNNTELKNWYDVNKWLPQNSTKDFPDPNWYKVVTENDRTFLRTSTKFGISSLLKPKIVIDDSVIEIELCATLRKSRDGHLVQIAISSRNDPSGADGAPFWPGRQDSGIMVQGYQYDLQYINFIAWQKAGRRVQMSVPKPPFNILDTETWVTWRLIYKHQNKQLCFYKNLQDAEPYIIQHNVDLTETALNSVWLGAWGTEYSGIEVYCTRKVSKK